MTVRAKFRLLEITRRYDGILVARLKAVLRKSGKNHPENEEFFKYSPNGECELTYQDVCPLDVGAYYYLDFQRVEEGHPDAWQLNRRVEEYDNVDVALSWWRAHEHGTKRPAGLFQGSFKVCLSVAASGARTALQPVKSLWSFAIAFAEANDNAP